MAEYIEREALHEIFEDKMQDDNKMCPIIKVLSVLEIIERQPAADVQEVKHGFWVQNKPNIEKLREFHKMGLGKALKETSIFYTCSCCNGWGTPAQNYCCNCGAKMDGVNNGN